MKINLLYGTDDILSGFLNIDPLAGKDDEKKILGPIDNLDSICEDAECDYIIANDIIDYFSSREVDKIIEHWLTKLRHGGKIIIGGVDINEVSKGFINKQIDLIHINVFLFGEQDKPWQFRKSALTANDLVKAIESFGLKIIKNRTNNYRYIVEAERL